MRKRGSFVPGLQQWSEAEVTPRALPFPDLQDGCTLQLKVAVAGELGLGKSTFIQAFSNALKESKYATSVRGCAPVVTEGSVVSGSTLHATLKARAVAAASDRATPRLYPSDVSVALSVVELAGYGDILNVEEDAHRLCQYMEDGLASHRGPLAATDAAVAIGDAGGGNRLGGAEAGPVVAAAGSGGLGEPTADDRVDCCLYFLHPAGNRAKRIDVEVMRRLQQFTAIIPCLAKVDAMTEEERAACCAGIRDQLSGEGIAAVPLRLDEAESVRGGASGAVGSALLASRKSLERIGASAEGGAGDGKSGPGGQPAPPLCMASSCVMRGGEPVRCYEWGTCRLAFVSDMGALIQNFSDISVVLALKRNTEAISAALPSLGKSVTAGSGEGPESLLGRSLAPGDVAGYAAGDAGYGEGAGGPWGAKPGVSDKLMGTPSGAGVKPRLRLGKVSSWLKMIALYALLVSCLRAPATTRFLSSSLPPSIWPPSASRDAAALSLANKTPPPGADGDADDDGPSAGHVDSEHRGFLRLLDRFDADAPVDIISDSGRPILFGIGREMAPVRLPLCAPYVVKLPTRHGALFRPSDGARGGMDMINIDTKRPRGGAALPDFYFSYAASDAVCLKQVCTDEFILAFPCVWPAKQQKVRVTLWRSREARPHLLEVHRKSMVLAAGTSSTPLANAFHVSEGNFLEMNQETEFLSLQLHIYALTGMIRIQDEARAGVYNSEAEVVMESAQSLYVSAWAPLLNAILKTLEYRRGPAGPPAFSVDDDDKARGGAGNQDRINAVLTLFRAGAAPLVEKVSLPVELEESAVASQCSADGSVFENGDIGLSEAEILVRCLDSTGQQFAASNDRVEAVLRAMGVTQRIMLSPAEERVAGSSNAPVFRARLLRPNVPFDLMVTVNGEPIAQGPSHVTVEKAMLCEGPFSDQADDLAPEARDPAAYETVTSAGVNNGAGANPLAAHGKEVETDAGARAEAGRGGQPGNNLAGWFMKRLGIVDAAGGGGGGGGGDADRGTDVATGDLYDGDGGMSQGQMLEDSGGEEDGAGQEDSITLARGASPSGRQAGNFGPRGGSGVGSHGGGKGSLVRSHLGSAHGRGGTGGRGKGAGVGPRGRAVPNGRSVGVAARGGGIGGKGADQGWVLANAEDVPGADSSQAPEFEEGGDDDGLGDGGEGEVGAQGGGEDGSVVPAGGAEGQEAGDGSELAEEGSDSGDEGVDDGGANGVEGGVVEGSVPAASVVAKKEEPGVMDPQALFRSLVKPGKNKVMQIAKAAANRGSKRGRGGGGAAEGARSNEFVEMSDIADADLVQGGGRGGQDGGAVDGEELQAEGATAGLEEER